MKVFLIRISLAAALLPFPAFAFKAVRLPVPQIETLPNGLHIAWFLDEKIPVTDLVLVARSGNRDDPAGKSGTAELLAASLDRGAAGMSAAELARSVEMLGATRFVSADEDTLSIGMHGLSTDAGSLLDLLAKVALHPDFPEAEVARERQRILDRWKHLGDSAESLAGVAHRRLLAAGTSYGRGSIRTGSEFARLARSDVIAFHRRHLTPANSILMVVGRVDPAGFREKIAAAFGGWAGEAPRHEFRNYSHEQLKIRAGEVLVIDRPGLTQAQVRMGCRAPSIHAPERYSLAVANALVGEYFQSRLNALIRDELAMTYGISSAFSYSEELATFTIASSTRNESVGDLIRRTLGVLKDLRGTKPPTDEEVAMAKDYLQGGFPLSTSTLGSVASRWLAGHLFGFGPEYLNEFIPKVSEVDRQAVISALRGNLNPARLQIVIAGDARAIQASLKKAGIKVGRTISANALM